LHVRLPMLQVEPAVTCVLITWN